MPVRRRRALAFARGGGIFLVVYLTALVYIIGNGNPF
jgi:hypothetical protein